MDDDACLFRRKRLVARLIIRFFQFGEQVGVVLYQVAEVCDGRFLVNRIRKIKLGQLSFEVRADSECRFVHILKVFSSTDVYSHSCYPDGGVNIV